MFVPESIKRKNQTKTISYKKDLAAEIGVIQKPKSFGRRQKQKASPAQKAA